MNLIKKIANKFGIYTANEMHDIVSENIKQYNSMLDYWKKRAETAEGKLSRVEMILKEYNNGNKTD